MFRHILNLVFFFFFGSFIFAQSGDRYDYINRYKDIAIREMERTGVPASIKLGQGILESNAGKSYLATKGNNHFGIKCGSKWKGKKVYRKDDDYDKSGKLIKSCFRAFKSADECYVAHSDFLRDPKKKNRYSFLFDLNPYDYKAWAKGLKKAGYATSKTYASKLIKVIEDYELYKYDRMSSSDLLAGNSKRKKRKENWDKPKYEIEGLDIQNNNDANLVLAREGQTPREIAEKADLKLKCVLKYNEKLSGPDEKLAAKTRVYIQPKRTAFRGSKKWHYVKSGETMYEISQIYGVKLAKLYKRNRLSNGAEPALGERIKLRGFKIWQNETPKTRNVEDDPEIPDLIEEEKVETEEEDPFMDESELITPDDPTDINQPKEEIEEAEEEIDLEMEEDEEEIEPEIPTVEPEEDEVIFFPGEPLRNEIYHIVQPGDTLYNISKRYDTTVPKIRELNSLTSNVIFRGQKLRVK